MRLTVEQDVLFPFIPNDKVAAMKEEPIFQKYKIDAGNLTRGLVSCTGAQVQLQTSPFLDQLEYCIALVCSYNQSQNISRVPASISCHVVPQYKDGPLQALDVC